MNDSYPHDDRPYRRDDASAGDGDSSAPRPDRGNDRGNDRSGDRGPRRGGYGGPEPRRPDVRDEVFSPQARAGRRRYFFDVRDTQSGDYYLTITEVKRMAEGGIPEKHKIFLYKEDFTKFINGLQDTIDYVKDNLLTADQLDDLERGDAQFEEDERYYREQRAQRAADDARAAPPRPSSPDSGYDAPRDTYDANQRDDYKD
ncbi:MAG: DUF3276 family protein [Hymenobacteraceae bacterium]|nr:DUF3276 family protein [Hymenobacteraceae bacterium]